MNFRHIEDGLRAVDLLEIINNFQNRWLGSAEVQPGMRLEGIAPRGSEKDDDKIIGGGAAPIQVVLVTAVDKLDLRVEVTDIPSRQIEDGGFDFKTDAPRT